MTREDLLSDLEQTTQQLIETFSQFTAENIYQRPFEQAWSAAHLADHYRRNA